MSVGQLYRRPQSGTAKTDNIYPWTEVDNPVELYDHAWFAFLESKLKVIQARAGSKQTPVKTTGFPDPHIALKVAAVLILCRLIWTNE